MPNVLEYDIMMQPDWEALAIGTRWREWNTFRIDRIEEWKELRNYVFATDTKTTANKTLPWSNSTTTPKLAQIRDNLHANYMAALFPQRQFFAWEAANKASNDLEKRRAIENYVSTKTDQSGYRAGVSKLVLDWIDTGNAFCMVEHVADYVERAPGDMIAQYIGPKIKRISPYDIVFNPLAADFASTPKIIKEIITLGDVKKMVEENPEDEYLLKAFEKMETIRGHVSESDAEIHKSDGFVADGFSSITQYLSSGYVELLHFYGDIYNDGNKELQTNRIITIADRSKVIRNIPNPRWTGGDGIFHSPWRIRPDNLYGMGPLENLVGLQYRVDHLENMKADVWDQIAYPTKKLRGEIIEYGNGLGEDIMLGEDGDVAYLAPDATALNADLQIPDLMNKMEELAGAPRNAMGIRTPGEKTAFEYNSLMTSASRIFEHKAAQFEEDIIEPTLNAYLESGRRHLDTTEEVRTLESAGGVTIFETVSREDVTAQGTLRPRGARHFAEKALRVQNLNAMLALRGSQEDIALHMSGKNLARIMSEEIGEERIYGEYIALYEANEAQRIMQELQINNQEEQLAAAEQGV